MNEISTIINTIKKFNEEREWEQFHNPKDLLALGDFLLKPGIKVPFVF